MTARDLAIVQVRQEAGVLTIPEAILSFVVADAGAELWAEWG